MFNDDLIFFQMFESETSTFTYLIGDSVTKECALIDPVIETLERDLKLVSELDLKLKYVFDTHIHADHITSAGTIRLKTGAKTAVCKTANVDCVDIPLSDGDELFLGSKKLKVIATPGHTNTCLSYLFEGMIFTGDALLIRGTGRTDFQSGSSETLYSSIKDKIFSLPPDTIVYPGHDYRGHTSSTVGIEARLNPRIGGKTSLKEFVQTMSELKLAAPKKIHEAVSANMGCGMNIEKRVLNPQVVDGIPEVTVQDVLSAIGKVRIVDVRRPDEFNAELSHIKGAELVTLGPDLISFLQAQDKNQEIVFVCRSGGRSGNATVVSRDMGYTKTANMVGGMLKWNESGLPTEK